MSFEDAAEAAPVDALYAAAQVDVTNEAVRNAILEFLQPDAQIVLKDLQQVMVAETRGGLKKGCPLYFATQENVLGGVIQHTLLQDQALSDVQELFIKCAGKIRYLDRAIKRADLDRNADGENPCSILSNRTRIDTIIEELGKCQAEVTALQSSITVDDLSTAFKTLQAQVRLSKDETGTDITALRDLLADLREKIEEIYPGGAPPHRPRTPTAAAPLPVSDTVMTEPAVLTRDGRRQANGPSAPGGPPLGLGAPPAQGTTPAGFGPLPGAGAGIPPRNDPVSYTHLTLPTILLV